MRLNYRKCAIFIRRPAKSPIAGADSLSWPFSKTSMKGTPRILNRPAVLGLFMMLSLPTRTLPLVSAAYASTIGPTVEQDGHVGDHAYNSTGRGDWVTCDSKFMSVIIMGWGALTALVSNGD